MQKERGRKGEGERGGESERDRGKESSSGGWMGKCFVAPEAGDTTRVFTASQWELFEG